MEKLIKLVAEIEPFTTADGVMCIPQNGLLPLGWEEELESRNIPFECIEIENEHIENEIEIEAELGEPQGDEMSNSEILDYINNNHVEPTEE